MVRRSIEQEIRNKNFGARSGNFEKNAVVKNQGTKQRVQRILADCWQWEANGQCVKGDNCSFRHDMDKRGKSSPSNPSQNFSCSRVSENHRGPEVPEVRAPVVARGMGSPRHATNRRRRTRKGPEPASVLSPSGLWGGTRRGGRMNEHPAVVPSSRRGKNLQ